MADSTNNDILIKLTALDALTPVMLAALQGMEATGQKMASALDGVKDSSDKTADSTEGLNGGVVTLAAGMELLEAGVEIAEQAFDTLYEQFAKGIEASEAAETAQNKLTGALISTGQYSAETSEEFNKFAESLQKTDGVSQDTTKSILAAGLQMGLSQAKAEGLVTASEKLAATTGQSVQEAFSTLNQTLAGHTKGLDKVLPQVKDFSAAQLKGGAAVDLVNASLNAQLELYQSSYAAGVQKASTAVEEIYKNLGDLITQNPAVKAAIGEVGAVFNEMSDFIVKNKEEINTWVTEGVTVGVDALEALNVTMDAAARVGSASFHGLLAVIDGFGAGMLELVSGPIKLVLEGIALLPGSGKAAASAVTSIDNAIASLKETSQENAAATVAAMNNQTSASKAVETGLVSMQGAIDKATASTKAYAATSESAKIEDSNRAAAMALVTKSYDGYSEGTEKQRTALALEASSRDTALKEFTTYLNDRERLAVSKAAEEEMQVNAIRAKALAGSGGEADKSGTAQVAIDSESKKQASLQVLRQKGILDEQGYNQAILASDQRGGQQELAQALASEQAKADALGESPGGFAAKQQILAQQQALQLAQAQTFAAAQGATAQEQAQLVADMKAKFFQQQLQAETKFNQQELQLATAHETALANALGQSPSGFQMKQNLKEQQFKMELQQNKLRAQQEGASQEQMDKMEESANQAHLADMKTMKEQWIQQDMAQNQTLGNNWQVSLDQIALDQEKFGVVMGTLRGVQQTEEYKGTETALSNLASLRSSKSKAAFQVGKDAAIAQATVNTFMSATEAFASMAAIPIVGPALGIAAAAAAVAAGFVNIQSIESQNFSGGQSDSGMDSIPQALSGKSFILSANERVVQPAANTDLTNFLAAQKSGGGMAGGGQPISVTLNYSGSMNQGDVQGMADLLITEIRKRSNRGAPIMSSKGIVQS